VTIVELAGAEDLIESFVDELRPFGIVELVRSGLVSMGRGIRVMEGANHTSKRFPQKVNGNGKHDSVQNEQLDKRSTV
jgi:acetolactate synthase-1/3 small subunit